MDMDIDMDINTDTNNNLMLKEEIDIPVDNKNFGKVIYHLNDMTIYQSHDGEGDTESKLYEFSIHVTLDDYNKQFWDTF